MNTGELISLENLIPVPQEIKDEVENLEQIQRDRQRTAYEALVTRYTPRDVIEQREGRGGKTLDYIKAWWFIEQANALFGHFWSFEVTDQYVGDHQVWVRGKVTITIPGEDFEDIFPDGTRRVHRRETMTITKVQFGGHDLAKKDGRVISVGDTLKAAATDSMKKCLSLVGIAADVYGDRETLEEERKQEEHSQEVLQRLAATYNMGKEMGWSQEEVEARLRLDLGKDLEDMTPEDGLEALRIMNRAKKEAADAVDEKG